MAKTADIGSLIKLLSSAAAHVMPAPGREPWDYGWGVEEYRHSDAAALSGSEGPVTIAREGIEDFELAIVELLKDQRFRERWEREESWGIIGSLIVAASEQTSSIDKFLEGNIVMLQSCPPALTLQLVANVIWGIEPQVLGDAVVGDATSAFTEAVKAAARGRPIFSDSEAASWIKQQVSPRTRGKDTPNPVAMACWTTGQSVLAFNEAGRQLQNIVDLSVLLEHDLKKYKVYHRGPTNRPGIRGLTLDRGAIDRRLGGIGRLELASQPLKVSCLGTSSSVHWYGAEPLPLGELLGQEYLKAAVKSCLGMDGISNRVKVAARWYAEAHYSLAADDAALALGVAMDALLNGQRAMPGSAMADRYAMLSDDVGKRHELVADYLEFYQVRSSVAHGGASRKLDDPDYLDNYRRAVHWAAWRTLMLREIFAVKSDKDIDSLYNDLRWGARSWHLSAAGASYTASSPATPSASRDGTVTQPCESQITL